MEAGHFQQRSHWFVFVSHAQRLRQDRTATPHHDRVDLTRQRAHQQLSSVGARFVHVQVRVRLVTNQHGAVVHDCIGHVGVKVKTDTDGDLGCDRPNTSEQCSFTIGCGLGHHRPVEVEHHRIAAGLDRRTDGITHVVVRVGVHLAAWCSIASDRRDDVPASVVGGIKQATNAGACPLEPGIDLWTFRHAETAAAESCEWRGYW